MCVIFKEPVNTPEFKPTKKLCFWRCLVIFGLSCLVFYLS